MPSSRKQMRSSDETDGRIVILPNRQLKASLVYMRPSSWQNTRVIPQAHGSKLSRHKTAISPPGDSRAVPHQGHDRADLAGRLRDSSKSGLTVRG